MEKSSRNILRKKRHGRIRGKIKGTQEKPRMNVFCSLKFVYVQVIDDVNNKVIAQANSLELKKKKEVAGKMKAAEEVGKLIADRCIKKGINEIVFDRGGYKYHGKIKTLADTVRKSGLKF